MTTVFVAEFLALLYSRRLERRVDLFAGAVGRRDQGQADFVGAEAEP